VTRVSAAALGCALLLWLLTHRQALHVSHAAYHNAVCLCPVCLIRDTLIEVSVGEYC
jgi:hypothetical protein